MANCEICGKKIGLAGQAYIGIPGIDGYLNVCKTCEDQVNNLYHPTEENVEQTKQYLSPFMDRSDIRPEVRDHIASLCNDADENLETKRKMSEEMSKRADVREEIKQRQMEEWQEARFSKSENMRDFMMTTGIAFEGYRIVKYITILTGESVVGASVLSEVGASVSDVLGTDSMMFEEKFSSAASNSVEILKERALNVGANALLAVQISITTLSLRNTIVAMASGTAVRVEKIE